VSSPRLERPSAGAGRALTRVVAGLWGTGLGAALLFAALTCGYLWPVLVGGRTLTPSWFLYYIPPWTPYAPGDLPANFNNVLSDIPTAYSPWQHLVRNSPWPLQWDPYALGGVPLLGNPQAGLFDPVSLLRPLFSESYASGIVAAIQLWLSAFGTYLLARALRLRCAPSVMAGVAFGFSAFSVLWLTYPLLTVVAMLPWALWLVERVLVGRRRSAPALVGVLAIALLAGHPGTQLHVFVIVGIYTILRALLVVPLWAERGRVCLVVLGACLLAGCVAAAAILPAALQIPDSAAQLARANGGTLIPRAAFRTLFFPDWWGRPSSLSIESPGNFNERTLYAGAVALVLAAAALQVRDQWRGKLPFVVAIAIGLEAPFGLQPLRFVTQHAPLLSNDRNARLSLLLPLGAAMLGGFGLQLVLDRAPGWRRATVGALGGAMLVAVTAVVAIDPSIHVVRTTQNHFRTGHDYLDANILALTSVVWWVLLAVGVGVIVLVLHTRLRPAVVAALVVALAAVDAGHFARGYQPMTPGPGPLELTPPSVSFLQDYVGSSRIVGIGLALPPDTSTIYKLRDIRGNDPPFPHERYLALFRLLNPAQAVNGWLAVPSVSATGRRVLDLLSVEYWIEAPGTPKPDFPGLQVVYSGPDAIVLHDSRAVPRTYVPQTVQVAPSLNTAIAAVADRTFVPGRSAVVEGGTANAGEGSARLTRDDPEAVDIHANLRRGGLVVLSDPSAQGWSVTVDGHAARTLIVDGSLRGVEVPAGIHAVRWRYETPGLTVGLAISGVGLVLLAIWMVDPELRRRPRRLLDGARVRG
jgi:membrane protein YfhO